MSNDGRLLDSAVNLGDYDDVLDWWLISPFIAGLLSKSGEVVICDYGCHWWGRQTSGHALYMDNIIQQIAEELY